MDFELLCRRQTIGLGIHLVQSASTICDNVPFVLYSRQAMGPFTRTSAPLLEIETTVDSNPVHRVCLRLFIRRDPSIRRFERAPQIVNGLFGGNKDNNEDSKVDNLIHA